MKRNTIMSMLITTVLCLTLPGIVSAEVLYDSTDMTDDQTYDAFMISVIGGQGSFGGDPGNVKDSQVAEDFVLNAAYDITSVTGDFFTHPDENAVPEDGILIEFFADLTGTPSEEPAAAIFATEFTTVHFTDTVFGFPTKNNIARLTVDLTGEGITLGPGTWWLSIVPVNALAGADAFAYQQLRTKFLVNGSITHARDGGIDHGTGIPGIYGFDDWTPIDEIGGGVFDPGDLAMKIEGTLVQPECPADLDGNGIVGASDLLTLLAAWGPNPGHPADFDGDGVVGASDLLTLLVSWGPCPEGVAAGEMSDEAREEAREILEDFFGGGEIPAEVKKVLDIDEEDDNIVSKYNQEEESEINNEESLSSSINLNNKSPEITNYNNFTSIYTRNKISINKIFNNFGLTNLFSKSFFVYR